MDWRERQRIKSRYETVAGLITAFITTPIAYFLGLWLLESELCTGMVMLAATIIGIQIGGDIGGYFFERKYES